MQSQFSAAYYRLDRALVIQKRYDKAIAAFEHVNELSQDALANFALAKVRLAKGHYHQALAEDAGRLSGTVARAM